MLPGTNAQIGADPSMRALQQPPPMNPLLAQQLQQQPAIAAPGAQPTPGYS